MLSYVESTHLNERIKEVPWKVAGCRKATRCVDVVPNVVHVGCIVLSWKDFAPFLLRWRCFHNFALCFFTTYVKFFSYPIYKCLLVSMLSVIVQQKQSKHHRQL